MTKNRMEQLKRFVESKKATQRTLVEAYAENPFEYSDWEEQTEPRFPEEVPEMDECKTAKKSMTESEEEIEIEVEEEPVEEESVEEIESETEETEEETEAPAEVVFANGMTLAELAEMPEFAEESVIEIAPIMIGDQKVTFDAITMTEIDGKVVITVNVAEVPVEEPAEEPEDFEEEPVEESEDEVDIAIEEACKISKKNN